ncbi:hypothetical protein EDC96DRAFT_577465 [Choanephora cucurbitarum]|nr:hypothetical protein EDC96DRAFT_577465 [Choanephora cucurbitarum]
MSESVPVSLERYVYHLKLHNRFAALIEQTEPEFQPLPEAKTVSAEDVDLQLALMKKNSLQVAEAEAALSRQNFTTVKNEEDVWNAYRCLQDNKNVVRSFYQNTKMKKSDMRREMFMKKSKDRIFARERLWLNPKVEAIKDRKGKQKAGHRPPQKQLIMMIGDRGMDVGSRIKQHLRYGGIWKQNNHACYTTVSITNENNTSQTCVNGCGVNGRDRLSALAMAISGFTTLLFQQTLPAFSRTISHSNTEFNHKTASFCTRSGVLATREA